MFDRTSVDANLIFYLIYNDPHALNHSDERQRISYRISYEHFPQLVVRLDEVFCRFLLMLHQQIVCCLFLMYEVNVRRILDGRFRPLVHSKTIPRWIR